jgi:hypothetical protein
MCLLSAQVSVPEPASDGLIIQPSTTKLYRLAQLRVGGNFGEKVPVQQFPPGLGALSALTSLTLCKVRDTRCYPLTSAFTPLMRECLSINIGNTNGPESAVCMLGACVCDEEMLVSCLASTRLYLAAGEPERTEDFMYMYCKGALHAPQHHLRGWRTFTDRLRRSCMVTVQVYFTLGMPLQSGLEALRVLEVVLCKGPLCIACALPTLQASGRPMARYVL